MSRARRLASAGPTKRRRVQADLAVESDLPPLAGVLLWERDLLVPIVEQLVDEVLGEDLPGEPVPGSEPHAKDRDQGVMKGMLRKRGIRVIAIYQETTDDPMGQFVEGIFELVDQYESDVNGMRTSAAMRKNAELGFHNGSKAPYGFVFLPLSPWVGSGCWTRRHVLQPPAEAHAARRPAAGMRAPVGGPAPAAGLEPATRRLTAACSTN